MNKPFAHQVLDAIHGWKTVTVEQLVPLFPQKKRHEISKALSNAEIRGLLKLRRGEDRGRCDGGVFARGVWDVLDVTPKHDKPCARVSCVWELGSGAVTLALPRLPGRAVSPLGGWKE